MPDAVARLCLNKRTPIKCYAYGCTAIRSQDLADAITHSSSRQTRTANAPRYAPKCSFLSIHRIYDKQAVYVWFNHWGIEQAGKRTQSSCVATTLPTAPIFIFVKINSKKVVVIRKVHLPLLSCPSTYRCSTSRV